MSARGQSQNATEKQHSQIGDSPLEGDGAGNIEASVGGDGIVIDDDQYAPLAEKIQAALKSITDKPVRFIIHTHFHGDHTGGNAYFQKQAPIIAQDNVRRRLESGGSITA
jgi:cyclase